MHLQHRIRIWSLGILLLLGSKSLRGDSVYGVGDGNGTGNTSELYQITSYSTTPAVTNIGNTGQLLTDLAINSTTHQFYGITFSDLYTLNSSTGASTLVGAFGTAGANAGLNSLEFDPSGNLYAWGSSDNVLYKVNPTTGTATAVGNTGFASGGDLAWDRSTGTLLGTTTTNQLIDINPSTGASTLIGTLSITGKAYGLIVDTSNAVYVGAEQTNHNVWIYSVNTSNAAVNLVGKITTTEGLDGMSAIPEPGSALLVMTCGLVLLIRRPRLRIREAAFSHSALN